MLAMYCFLFRGTYAVSSLPRRGCVSSFFRYFLHIYSILITIFENLLQDKVQCLIFLMNYEHENKTKPVEVIITSGHYFL